MELPALSVVVPTIRGWPRMIALGPLLPQAERVGAEVVVVDASGGPRPDDLPAFVRWESKPGWSVFQLRAWGYAAARGDIVAVTEDHCLVADDWCDRILAAHAEHPDALVIGGAVENASDQSLVDWAAFLNTQAPFIPPLGNGSGPIMTSPANVSYKRAALEHLAVEEGEGVIDFLRLPRDGDDGQMVADDRLRVRHLIHLGFWRTSRAEYDNGRTISGYRRPKMESMDWVRIATAGVLPIYRTWRTIQRVRPKDVERSILVRSVPLIFWFEYCAAVGQLAGYAAGPGDSPNRLL